MTTKVKLSSWDTYTNVGYVSVQDYGATGDGTTDDTAAIVLALAVGVPVFFPPGTYICTALSPAAGSTLFGTGPSSILKMKTAISGLFMTISSTTVIKDLAIDGNKAGQSGSNKHALYLFNAVTSRIRNVKIYNTLGDGINIAGPSTNDVLIQDCYITGFTKTGITVEEGNDIRIVNCTANSSDGAASPGDGIALAPTSATPTITLATITGCVAKSNVGRGIAIAGNGAKNVTNVTCSANRTSLNTSHGLHIISAQQVTVHGGIHKSNTGDGIRLEGDTVYCRVGESVVDGNTGYGIREIVSGSTPNNNGFMYVVSLNNGTNTVTVVGGSSFAKTS